MAFGPLPFKFSMDSTAFSHSSPGFYVFFIRKIIFIKEKRLRHRMCMVQFSMNTNHNERNWQIKKKTSKECRPGPSSNHRTAKYALSLRRSDVQLHQRPPCFCHTTNSTILHDNSYSMVMKMPMIMDLGITQSIPNNAKVNDHTSVAKGQWSSRWSIY